MAFFFCCCVARDQYNTSDVFERSRLTLNITEREHGKNNQGTGILLEAIDVTGICAKSVVMVVFANIFIQYEHNGMIA